MSRRETDPLDGVRVVDSLGGLIGGYCSKVLCDAGAEVIVLEPPEGDPLRTWRVGDDPDGGALFSFLRAGQDAVEIAEPPGPDVKAWAATADCVIIGLDGPDPTELTGEIPGLVVISITPYGREGPWAQRPATDFTLQADSGGLSIRGRPDRAPYHAAGRTGDWISAVMAATAGIACLRRARASGVGAVIDLSRAECTNLAMTNHSALMAELRGPAALRFPPAITETPAVEPTADGFVVFTTNTQQQFNDFCVLLGHPELAERYASAASRQKNWAEWNEIVHTYTRGNSTESILETASALRIPVAPVCNGATAPEVTHFVERDVYRRDPTGTFIVPRRPWIIAGQPVPALRSAPAPAEPRAPDASAPEPAHSGAGVEAGGLPLAGITVIDSTAWWAGPMATWLLATLGADVIHVEATQRPDGMRLVGGAFHDQARWWERSWFFLATNTNKQGLTLDLTSEAGRDLYLRLVETADVVVENYTPRVFDQFGLTWDELEARNQSLIFARMPAFGLDGPWRDRPGFAQTMESLSGLAWVTGHVDDQPRLQGGPCDPNAGTHAAFAIIAALARRDRTGTGCLLEIPMVESALNIAAEQVIEHSAYGTLLERAGNRGPHAAPQGLYPTREGWLALSVEDDRQWRALCAVIATPAGTRELTSAERHHDHDRIDGWLESWAKALTASEAAAALQEVGVPAAVARDPRLAPTHPQFRARGFFEAVDHPVVGTHQAPGLPFRLSTVDRWIGGPAPTLGQHNKPILSRLGLSPGEIAKLAKAGTIGDAIA